MNPVNSAAQQAQPTGRCPLCNGSAAQTMRYPRALCIACIDRATDVAGRPVRMGNTHMTGGFAASYRDDGSLCEQVSVDGRVLVDGVACRAGEHYFGGIVVVPLA